MGLRKHVQHLLMLRGWVRYRGVGAVADLCTSIVVVRLPLPQRRPLRFASAPPLVPARIGLPQPLPLPTRPSCCSNY